MKFTKDDIHKLRAAFAACKLADIDLAVISEGKIRGLSESRNAAIISELALSIDSGIQLGITRLSELIKRLALFGDEIDVEAELTAESKVRKLAIRGSASKIEFRCTDVAMLDKKYPKANNDVHGSDLKLTREQVHLVSKGVKTLGADALTIQIKRDGAVHIESADSSNDRFEFDTASPAVFADDATSSVFNYNTSSTGVILPLLENAVKDHDHVVLRVMKSGNIGVMAHGHMIIVIPRITTGV